MKKQLLLLVLIIFTGCKTTQNIQKPSTKFGENDPYYELDGKQIFSLQNIDPKDVTALDKYDEGDEEAIKLFGEKAKYGALIIQTREFAKKRYEAMFSSFSKNYEAMIKKEDNDDIQYILNNEILVGNYFGILSNLDTIGLKSISLINSEQLRKKYRVKGKSIGVVIKAKIPNAYYAASKKKENNAK